MVAGRFYRKTRLWLLLLIVGLSLALTALPAASPATADRTGHAVWAHRYQKYRHCEQCTVKCRTNWLTGHETCRRTCRVRHCDTR